MAEANQQGATADAKVLGSSTAQQIGASNTVTNSTQVVPIAIPCYQNFALQKGDNDATKTWGGKQQTTTGSYVADLQTDLKSFGVFVGDADGDFGNGTEAALKRYQWVAKTLKKRLVTGTLMKPEITYAGGITGKMDDATCAEIKLWKEKSYVATGNLVKVPVSNYDQFQRGTLSAVRSDVANSDMVADEDFLAGLASLNAAAKTNSIKISVNQVLRVQGATVSGAVVTPATKSQHLIEHAVDTNMIDGTQTLVSANFVAGTATQHALDFIRDAKAAGLRWGGDFGAAGSTTYDPPHFDLQVPSTTDVFDFKFFFNQRQLSENQPIPSPD